MPTLYQDEVTLPSRGLLNGNIPDGKMTIAMMGTQEEKLLAGSRGSGSKITTQLLDRLIVSPKVPSVDLLIVDRAFLLIKIRILTFGSSYGFRMNCPNCDRNVRFETDLSQIEINNLPEDFEEPFEVTLPILGQTVWLKLLRGTDEEKVNARAKKATDNATFSPGDPLYIPMLARSIHHTQDLQEQDIIGKELFVQNLKSMDSYTIQNAIEELKLGPDMNTTLNCPSCVEEVELQIPFSEEFFRPKLSRVAG